MNKMQFGTHRWTWNPSQIEVGYVYDAEQAVKKIVCTGEFPEGCQDLQALEALFRKKKTRWLQIPAHAPIYAEIESFETAHTAQDNQQSYTIVFQEAAQSAERARCCVVSGERSLFEIAENYDAAIADLFTWNPELKDAFDLEDGAVIRVQ